MREKLLLVGSGGFGRVVSEHAIKDYDCAFVDDGYAIGTCICGIPVVGKIADLALLRKEYDKLVVTIGNNKLREKIYEQAKVLAFRFPNIICQSAYVSPFAKIGCGCVLLNYVSVQNGSTVGNGVLLNHGVEIHHDCSVDDYCLIYSNSVVRTYAKVGKRVRIGSNVTISNDVVVADDSDIKNGETL